MDNEVELLLKAKAAAIKATWIVQPHYKKKCSDCDRVVPMCGRTYRCPECQAAYNKLWAKLNRESRRQQRKGGKTVQVGMLGVWVPTVHKIKCEYCRKSFTPQRSTARFCSDKCRVYASRKPRKKK